MFPTIFDVEKLEKEILDLKQQLNENSNFSDYIKLQELSKSLKKLENLHDVVSKLQIDIQNLQEFINMAENECDENVVADINNSLTFLEGDVKKIYLQVLLNSKYDDSNAIIKIHSGAGGTEACDWVQMLYRMYKMYAEKNKFKFKLIDCLEGDGAGYKNITFLISGENAYGYLKGEIGVHRLVRISPFDSNKRRHTSFASVEVMPEIENNVDVEIKDEDIRIDTYRSSGAGGQHVNTTDSSVRITHNPTGIVVTCQNERSQIQNREVAMKVLIGKLTALEIEKQRKESLRLKGDEKKIEWGSQIRSYVFCPYTLVKDLRTNFETSDLESVMNGNINEFIVEYLKWSKNYKG